MTLRFETERRKAALLPKWWVASGAKSNASTSSQMKSCLFSDLMVAERGLSARTLKGPIEGGSESGRESERERDTVAPPSFTLAKERDTPSPQPWRKTEKTKQCIASVLDSKWPRLHAPRSLCHVSHTTLLGEIQPILYCGSPDVLVRRGQKSAC